MGRLYCDPPQILTEGFIQQVATESPDILIVTGDITGHTYAQEYPVYNPVVYESLEQIYANFSQFLYKYLPNTLFIPTFGNNDFRYHYQSPTDDFKKEFYGKIFDMWFTKHPTNSKLMDLNLIRQTFMYGGYYRVNLPQASSNVSILAMNTISFSTKDLT